MQPFIASISPLDSRYAEQTKPILALFNEGNLILSRLLIEIEWLIILAKESKIKEIKPLTKQEIEFLHDLANNLAIEDIDHIKELEQQIKHDVKAVEYYLKEKLKAHPSLSAYCEFVHFGCTSDDINNLSYAVILDTTREKFLLHLLHDVMLKLETLAHDYANIPMLARTHGQPASPTTVGKEFANFQARLIRQFNYFVDTPVFAKFNGAVGNFNAHYAAYPEVDWQKLCQKFVENFKIGWNPYTTQIEPHDWIAEYCDILARFNTIFISLCRDIWYYISIGYFKQKVVANEVGSSTMPHKVNPIDFENAEGNLGVANALLQHFSSKLPISRWQRDLTDSTVMRNLGVAIGHCFVAYQSLLKGLDKLEVDRDVITQDLNNHWEILAEAVQTVMRRYKIAEPYEKMKALTRGQKLDRAILHDFINASGLPEEAKQKLLKLTPENYLGKAVQLARDV